MGRAPCCDKANVKRGPWSPEEDETLKRYLKAHGTGGNWITLPAKAGLKRCGKSCRLRWLNYLRPDIKHGGFTEEEDNIICSLYSQMGSRWSIIASQLPGRTDNDVKNYWNTKLKKKLLSGKITLTSNNNIDNLSSINPAPVENSLPSPPYIPKPDEKYSLHYSQISPALPLVTDHARYRLVNPNQSLNFNPTRHEIPQVSEFGASTAKNYQSAVDNIVTFSQEGSIFPGLSSYPEDAGTLMDVGLGFAYDLVDGSNYLQEKGNELVPSSYTNAADFVYPGDINLQ